MISAFLQQQVHALFAPMRRLASSAVRHTSKAQGRPTCANRRDIVNFMNFASAGARYGGAAAAA
jgi:hypothetical protein